MQAGLYGFWIDKSVTYKGDNQRKFRDMHIILLFEVKVPIACSITAVVLIRVGIPYILYSICMHIHPLDHCFTP
jgi:hypothetical protein